MTKAKTRPDWRRLILPGPENIPGERRECALRVAMRARDGAELGEWLEMLGLTGYESKPPTDAVPLELRGDKNAKAPAAATGGEDRAAAAGTKAKTQRRGDVA